jgi:hypothetical protein
MIIGDTFMTVTESAVATLKLNPNNVYLAQGTLRPDLIESGKAGLPSRNLTPSVPPQSLPCCACHMPCMQLDIVSEQKLCRHESLILDTALQDLTWLLPRPMS